jgi:2-C-methyl-D-erythritol 4-phosphate cytidylyltransferase
MAKRELSIILASGGKGLRFGETKAPKQYIKIKNIPIFLFSVMAMNKISAIKKIIVAKSSDIDDSYFLNLFKKFKIKKEITLINGKNSRFKTVKEAFEASQIETPFVGIHDAVRPNFNFTYINQMMSQIGKSDGIIPVSKITSTIKRVRRKSILKTIPREELYVSQTPQIFKTEVIVNCYKKIKKSNINFTDESEMVEKNGFNVQRFEMNKNNIKITTKEDLKIFKALRE